MGCRVLASAMQGARVQVAYVDAEPAVDALTEGLLGVCRRCRRSTVGSPCRPCWPRSRRPDARGGEDRRRC